MKTETKFYRSRNAAKPASKLKTLDMKLSISNQDLGIDVRKAFDLAKSSGQELNLFFSRGTC